MNPSPVSIPASWNFEPLPTHARWHALGRLARGDMNEVKRDLALLMEAAEQWDVAQAGPAGTPVLVQVLKGWESVYAHSDASAHLPIPGEAPWDGTGNLEPWALPAALLVARGADPFVTDKEGRSGFSMALGIGSAALCRQMLRLPHAPPPAQWPLLAPLRQRNPARPLLQKKPALHVAATTPANPHLLRILLEAGAPVDDRDARGMTALMQAHPENASALLRAGADPMACDHLGLTGMEHWAISEHTNPALGRGRERKDRKEFWNATLRALTDPQACSRAFTAAMFFGDADLVQAVPGKPRRNQWAHTPAPFGLNAIEWGLVGSLLRPSGQRCLVDTLNADGWPDTTKSLAETVACLRKQGPEDDERCTPEAVHRLSHVWREAGLPAGRGLSVIAALLRWPTHLPQAIPMALAACTQHVLPFLMGFTAWSREWSMNLPEDIRSELESIGSRMARLPPSMVPSAPLAVRMQLWGRALDRNSLAKEQLPLVPLPEDWAGSPAAAALSKEWPLLRAALVARKEDQAVALGDAAILAAAVSVVTEANAPRPRPRM